MTQKTFTAEQIKAFAHAVADVMIDGDYHWTDDNTVWFFWKAFNEGKPEAERVSLETVFGWFGVECPSWAKWTRISP